MGDSGHDTIDVDETTSSILPRSNVRPPTTYSASSERANDLIFGAFPRFSLFSMDTNSSRHVTSRRGVTNTSQSTPSDSSNNVQNADAQTGEHASNGEYVAVPTIPPEQVNGNAAESNTSNDEIGASEKRMDSFMTDFWFKMKDEQMRSDIWHLVFRLQNIFPFVILLLIYFAYHHTKGIVYFTLGTGSLSWLDQKFRLQVSLKENINRQALASILFAGVCDLYLLVLIGATPWRQFVLMRVEESKLKTIWDVLWIVMLNDFAVRTTSIIVKALVTCVKSSHLASCCIGRSNERTDASVVSESGPNTQTVAPYRRKRKLYAVIEFSSLFIRTLIAVVPWCQYYQASESKVVADLFTFAYVFFKGIILASQARHIRHLVRSFRQQHLDYGNYVSPQALLEAESPDCSICYDRMTNPVQLDCTHMFCEECVSEWFDRERTCPLCRADVSRSDQAFNIKPRFLDGSTAMVPQLF